MRIVQIGAVALGGLLAAAAGAEEKMFEPPMHAGHRVDICRVWGSECGQPAADEFCRLQGFERADFFSIDQDIGAATPTRTLVDGKVCDQGFCDGFGAISCTRSGAVPQSSTTPAAPQPRPGRLKLPGWSSSPPTSPQQQPAEPPGEEPPPPSPPPPQPAGPPWTPQDVKDSRIDVQGQYALFRLLKGDPAQRIDASNILSAIKAGALKGIYQEDQQVPAMRATELGQWWGQILPKGADGVCMTEPAGKPPIIAMRRGTPPDKTAYDAALVTAWQQCGIAPIWPVRPYDPSAAPGDPPGNSGLLKCNSPGDETRMRAQCDHMKNYNMIGCDLAVVHGGVELYGVPLYSYEECAERVDELLKSCQADVSKMCGK
jgi:hypothetical protein